MIDLPQFRAAPDAGKVAGAGRWETAVAFQPGELTDVAAAADVVAGASDVACEAFFSASFIGLRRTGPPADLARFIVTFAECLRDAVDGDHFVSVLAGATGVPFLRDFRYAEVGAEGAWRSVGAFRIRDPGGFLADLDTQWPHLAATSLGRDTAHDKALEFSYDNGWSDGTTHWVALPVSDDRRLSRSMLTDALRSQLLLTR